MFIFVRIHTLAVDIKTYRVRHVLLYQLKENYFIRQGICQVRLNHGTVSLIGGGFPQLSQFVKLTATERQATLTGHQLKLEVSNGDRHPFKSSTDSYPWLLPRSLILFGASFLFPTERNIGCSGASVALGRSRDHLPPLRQFSFFSEFGFESYCFVSPYLTSFTHPDQSLTLELTGSRIVSRHVLLSIPIRTMEFRRLGYLTLPHGR